MALKSQSLRKLRWEIKMQKGSRVIVVVDRTGIMLNKIGNVFKILDDGRVCVKFPLTHGIFTFRKEELRQC